MASSNPSHRRNTPKKPLRIEQLERRTMLAADFSVDFLSEPIPLDFAFSPPIIANERVASDLGQFALQLQDRGLREPINTPSVTDDGVLGGLLELDSFRAAFSLRLNSDPVAEAWQIDASTIADVEQNAQVTSPAVERDDQQETTECQSCEGGLIAVVSSALPSSVVKQEVGAVQIDVDPIMGHVRNVELAYTPGHDVQDHSTSATTLVSLNINNLSDQRDREYAAIDISEVSGGLWTSLFANSPQSSGSQSLHSGMNFDVHHFDPLGSSTDPKGQMKQVDETATLRELLQSVVVHTGLDGSASPFSDAPAAGQLLTTPGNGGTNDDTGEGTPRGKLIRGATLIDVGASEVESLDAQATTVSEIGFPNLQAGAMIASGVLLSSSWYYSREASRRYTAGDVPRQRLKALLNDDGDS